MTWDQLVQATELGAILFTAGMAWQRFKTLEGRVGGIEKDLKKVRRAQYAAAHRARRNSN